MDAASQKGLLSRSKAYTVQGTVEIYNVTYDARSRLTQQNWIVPGSGGGTFRLDHTYNVADQPATLRYPGGTAGEQGELVTTGYYEGGGLRRSGYSSNNGVFYMLSDHLKSTSALVARNGVLNVRYFYFPYGARRGVPFNSITAKRFTGQYHETALPGGEGLSFYNARW